MGGVQTLANQFGGCALPPKLGAAPASRPGLLPPLGQEGTQGLPAVPGDGGAEAAKSGKKKKAKDEAKHLSSKDSSSSSEDIRTELFRDAASSGSWVNKIQRVAQESPGALLDSGLKGCSRPETIGKDTSLLPSCQTRGQSWEKKEMPSEASSGQGISCRATCRRDG